MQLLLAPLVIKRLERELRRAGSREIGGLLMGEHLGNELFRVVDISVQRTGGSHSCFTRNPNEHRVRLEKFFAQTGSDYARFNYLGEWHSHPSFEPLPSATDVQTMQSIVEDPDVGVNFLVLLIAKLGEHKRLNATGTAFRAGTPPISVPLSLESNPATQINFAQKWFRKLFGSDV